MKPLINFYRSEDDGTGTGEVTADGTVTEQKAEMNFATREDIIGLGDIIGNKLREVITPQQQAHEEDETIPDEVMIDPDKMLNYLKAKETKMREEMRQEMLALNAPLVVKAGLADLNDGLDKVGKAFIEEQFEGLTDIQKATVLSNPKSVKLLKNAARMEMQEKAGVPIPGASGVAGPKGSDGLSAAEEAQLQGFMRATNMPREEAIKTFKEVKAGR